MKKITQVKKLNKTEVYDISMPDIHNFVANDIVVHNCDFGERGPIIKYMKDKYGCGFAQAGTIQKYKTKAAIKKIMNSVYSKNGRDKEVMDLCDLIPASPQGIDEGDFFYGYTDKEGVFQEGAQNKVEMMQTFYSSYPKLSKLLKKMLGLPSSIGRHASAAIVASFDLNQRVPTTLMMDGELGEELPVTQYDAIMCDKLGLIKLDILGVTTIKVVQSAMDKIKKNHGLDLYEEDERGVAKIYRLEEDQDVFDDVYRKDTNSSFQFNTDLVKKYLPQFKPTSVYDLSLITALVRPGALDAPMDNGMFATDYYLAVKNKKIPLTYIHDDLEPILNRTNGVMVFQETVMKILVDLIGYSLEEADQIRAAISKKKRDVIVSSFERSRSVLSEKGWTLKQIESLNNQILAFSSYSFNISHSLCYANLGYITLYLKNKFNLEWWASELDESSEDKIREYLKDLRISILPTNLKNPSSKFVIEGDKIRAPISAIKGLGPSALEEILLSGPFEGVDDFIQKVSGRKVNKKTFKVLVESGGADAFLELDDNSEEGITKKRNNLLDYYLKKTKKDPFPEEDLINNELDSFFRERELFSCFNKKAYKLNSVMNRIVNLNKHILKGDGNSEITAKTYQALSDGGSVIKINKDCDKNYFLLDSSFFEDIATNFVEKYGTLGDVYPDSSMGRHQKNKIYKDNNRKVVAFCGFFVSSEVVSGVSKPKKGETEGRNWRYLRIKLTDGHREIDCMQWGDDVEAIRKRVGSLVTVFGTLKMGWKGGYEITLSKRIESIYEKD